MPHRNPTHWRLAQLSSLFLSDRTTVAPAARWRKFEKLFVLTAYPFTHVRARSRRNADTMLLLLHASARARVVSAYIIVSI